MSVMSSAPEAYGSSNWSGSDMVSYRTQNEPAMCFKSCHVFLVIKLLDGLSHHIQLKRS